jgi:hypothetical protein
MLEKLGKGRDPRVRTLAVATSLLLISALFVGFTGQVAAAAPCPKVYGSVIGSQTNPWTAGTAGSFTVTFTNNAPPSCSLGLGSIEIRVDSDFSGVSVGSVTTSNPSESWVVNSVVGNTVRVNASGGTSKVNSGESVSVTINATPAPCTAGTFPINSTGWVATDFTNSTFSPAAPYPPTVTVTAGACVLAFRVETSPGTYTSGVPLAAQKGTPFQVQVEAEDGSGHKVPINTGSVSLSINSQSTRPDGAIGTLSGNVPPKPLVNGVATFNSASIDVSANYTLKATSPGLTDAISLAFSVVDSLCGPGGTCSSTYSQDNKLLLDVSVNNPSTASILLSLGLDFPPDCNTATFTDPFFHAPVAWTTDSIGTTTNAGNKVLVVRITKAWRQMVLDRGVSSYRPCVTGPLSAWSGGTWNGSPLTITGGQATGLLPDCSGSLTAWCLSYVKGNKAGDVLEGIALPIQGPDPHGK